MKHYKILFLTFGMMLISTFISAQTKVKCTNCKNGIATWTQTVSCPNCKNWADSYRNIKGCDVCKNNKVITIRKQSKCPVCKGTTWTTPYRPAPPTKEEQILKKLKDLNITPVSQGLCITLNSEVSNMDIVEFKIQHSYSENNLWYLLGSIMVHETPYSSCKERVLALLDYYEYMYNKLIGYYKNNYYCDGFYYPSPNEVRLIKNELDSLNLDPNYEPNFFGYISASKIVHLY